ncbi:hypothetical protein MKZ20_21500 [Psychrobacillus sp. FSL K6-2684]|uniref:hypothetical protein n=1 Tax=unclassified Psychrobacillus TaxID=2636677 RepID=UPI0030FC59ED
MFFKKIIALLIITTLLISCASIEKGNIADEVETIGNLNKEWAKQTNDLIKLGEIKTDQYVDYSSILNNETSLDETWNAIKIFSLINFDYEKSKVISFVSKYEPDNIIEELKINNILNMMGEQNLFNKNYDNEFINLLKKDITVEEKLDSIYLFHLYTGDNFQLSKSTINLIKNYLQEVTFSNKTHIGYYYDLIYLCKKYNVVNPSLEQLDPKIWSYDNVEIEQLDLLNLYYIAKINELNNNTMPRELLNKLSEFKATDGLFHTEKKQDKGTIFATYIMAEIFFNEGKIEQLNLNNDKVINNLLIKQDNISGGFYIRKNLRADLPAKIFSELSLKALGKDDKSLTSGDIEKMVLNEEENNWKMKYYGYKLLNLSTEDLKTIEHTLNNYWDNLGEITPEKLLEDLKEVENIIYSIYISVEINSDVPRSLKKLVIETSSLITENYKEKNPIEISLALEAQNLLNFEDSKSQDIKSYLLNFYDEKQNVFDYNGQSEMMINYFIIKSLLFLDYDNEKVNLEEIIYMFADFENGGFNTFKNQFNSSSLLTTFYGLDLLKEIQFKKEN